MVASLVGDPARANMLTALMTGRALTASELAQEAGITPQTASSHLSKLEAGGLGVQMLDSMRTQKLVRQKKQDIELTTEGARFLEKNLQISQDMLAHPRRPVCKACLDWSERRHHLAGTLGAAMMSRFTELKWAARDQAPGSRVVNFTRVGEKRFAALFPNGES